MDDIPGFISDEELITNRFGQPSLCQWHFLSAGRASYILGNDGERVWLPCTLACSIDDLNIVTQTYMKYDPV